MTNEVDEHEMAHAIGTVGEENEVKAKEKGLGDKNKTEEQVGNNNKEDNVERTPYVNTNAENKVSDRNSNLIEGKDTELRTSDTNKPQKIISEDIDEPPDSFFDELLEDDFLDSLAVVDAWTPDADDSYGSDADEKNKTREEEDRHNKKTESEDKRKDREETISRNSRGKSRRDKCEHWGSGGQNDWRRHNEVSVETKWRSRERSVDKVYIRDKDGTGEQLHIVGREMHRRYKSMKERSRERIISRRENDSRGSKERNSLRTWKGNRDSTEKNIHRRDRNSREKSTERNIHSRYRGYKDKSVEININRRESGKSTEGSVQKEDKNGDIASMSHRYSYQNRLSNKKRIADRSARESSSDLQHGVSDVCVEGKDGVVQEREQSPKVVTRKEEGPSESHRKEESSELNIANKGKRGSVHNEHNLEKTMSQGASETAKNGAENRMTEKIAGSQSHVLTKPNKPLLNNTKLDTCMKELDDLVPPGTEEDFILPTKDEALIVVDELKEEDNTYLEEKHECEIINNEFLSQDRKNALMCSFEKSSKRCMIKTENQSKKIYVISRNKDEHKMLESDKREEVSLCNTNPCLHKEVERVNSPHRTNRRRSGSNRSEGRRSSASGSKKRHHLDEVVKRKLIRCTSEEKKRSSSSLEREFEAARVRNELFNERMRKRRLLGSGREENCSRSRSRERWQRHSDPHGPKRRKDDQNDTRQLWSGGRDKKLELGLERERLGRFRSHDRQYRKIQDDIRHSRSASRDKQVRTQVGRSRSLERHYKKASSGEGWQFHVDAAQRPKRKKDVQNDSRSLGYNTSSHPALSTFPPTTVPFPADPTLYSYPSEPGFSGAVPQPPSPDNQTVPPSFGSAPPHHLELPPAPPVKPTAHILPPVPAAVYGAPPSPAPLGFIGQPATLSYSSEFPSPEKVFNRALHTIEKSQDPLQVPPPPKISQSDDEKKMSLSSLLEASVKVGGSAKRKRMSVDPELVVRCEEAIHTLQANDGMILVSPGHLVLQESSRLYSSVAAVTHASLEDVNKFRSPILRTPYPQLSFTSMPACDEETAEPFYHLPKIDFATSVEGQSQIHGARLGPHALTSSYAPGSTENLKLYVDSSTMTDIHGDEKASNNCLACLERMNRVMVWNSTQTPITEVGNKVMVWNSTQTPHASVESVGVQAQIVKMGTLRKWFARKKVSHKVKKVKTEDIVKSDNVTESVSKCSYTSHYNAGEISGSCFDMTPTAGLEEDINEEVASESTHLSPEQSLSSSSASNKGGHRDEAPFYKTSTYQGYVSNHGKNSSSLYSSGSSVKESVLPSHVSLRTVPPKGILKTRSNVELQPPPLLLPPSPQMLWQQSSQRKSDLPGSMREFGSAPDLFGMRSTSSSLGGMGTSSAMQPAASSTGSVIYGSTAASFPKFGNPSIGSTLTRDQNLYALHHNQFSPLLQGSGNPGAGLGMQSFQPQSCMAFQQTGKPSMMSHDTDSCY